MGRPSKLSDRQWAEIGRRLAGGESTRKLGKEFGVAGNTISERFSERVPKLKALAASLASTEREVELLPVTEQCTVRNLADQLKQIAGSLASAARHGADTADRLAEMANRKTRRMDPAKPDPEDVRTVAALTAVSTAAANIGVNLMAANKGAVPIAPDDAQDQPTLSNLSDAELDLFITLQEKAGGGA